MSNATIAAINAVNAILADTTIAPIVVPATPKAKKVIATTPTIAGERTLSTEPGTITKGQIKRITGYSERNGFDMLDMSNWSMAVASTYYNDMKAIVADEA